MPRYAFAISEKELKCRIVEMCANIARTEQSMTVEEFKTEMEKTKEANVGPSVDIFEIIFDYMKYHLLDSEIIKKDLKIKFDMENVINMKFRTRGDGVTLLEFEAGGDWERPVFTCLYFDGKHIRAYIPTEGNVFNEFSKTALSGENTKEELVKFVKKHFPAEYEDICDEEDDDIILEDCLWEIIDDMDLKFDYEKLRADTDRRIVCKPILVRTYESEFEEWLSRHHVPGTMFGVERCDGVNDGIC